MTRAFSGLGFSRQLAITLSLSFVTGLGCAYCFWPGTTQLPPQQADALSLYLERISPVEFEPSSYFHLPPMPPEALESANQKAKADDPAFYGDLAAVLLRLNRVAYSQRVTSQFYPFGSEVGRLFARKYQTIWEYTGDEVKLGCIADWIVRNADSFTQTKLLEQELKTPIRKRQ